MDKYREQNRKLWNELTPIHEGSDFYDAAGFKKGKCTLKSIELEELGDVSGKSMLHLQCHFGLDTLSWARMGAKVTGIDFSDEAISSARKLSRETGIKADFICTDIHLLPNVLKGEFDIIFTSYGVLCWLPDLPRWAEIIDKFLKAGGIFYIVEDHPIMNVFDDSADTTELIINQSYFHMPEPIKWEAESDYAVRDARVTQPSYQWTHSLSDIFNAIIGSGLRIEYLHEFPVCSFKALPFMKEDSDGWWRLEGDLIPLTFSLKATKHRV